MNKIIATWLQITLAVRARAILLLWKIHLCLFIRNYVITNTMHV